MTATLTPFIDIESVSVTCRQSPRVACGDLVLYRDASRLAPARLVQEANGGWLARDARHVDSLVYLESGSIASRLPQSDLIGEAV